jgi:signal transduction histidine kinase
VAIKRSFFFSICILFVLAACDQKVGVQTLSATLLRLDEKHANGHLTLSAYRDSLSNLLQERIPEAPRADILRRLGICELEMARYPLALQHLQHSLQLSLQLNDTFAAFSTRSSIADAYTYMGFADSAEYLSKQCYYYFAGLPYPLAAAPLAYNLALTSNTDSAAKYARLAWELRQQVPAEQHAWLPDSISFAILLLEHAQDSEKESRIAGLQQWADKQHNPYLRLKARIALARFQPGAHARLKDSIMQDLSHRYSLAERRDIYRSLGAYYAGIQQFDSALHYTQLYQSIQDSFSHIAKINSALIINEQFKTLRDAERLALQSANKNKNRWLGASILAFIALLIMTFLYYRNNQIQAKIQQQHLALKENEIKHLLQEQELHAVNAALAGKDEERTRIARELHDRLGQILALTKLNFSALREDIRKLESKSMHDYERVSEMLDEASTEVRRISHDLYGSSVINFGISTALYQLADAVAAANRLKVQFQSHQVPTGLSLDAQINLYRIAGELISNTLKYAEAGRIDMQLIGKGNGVTFTYEDNGKGFTPSEVLANPGLGYRNIQSRLTKINGTFVLESAPEQGMFFQTEIQHTIMPETLETKT